MNAALSGAIVAFCTMLREQHGFAVGRAQAHDVLLATDRLGIEDRGRLKIIMRALCCSRPDETALFNRLFDEYFASGPAGVAQPHRARRFRPGGDEPPRERQSRYELESVSAAERWEMMRARYSAQAAAASPPAVPGEGFDRADALVKRLIAKVALGRSRRLRPSAHGPRIDLRRTLRAGLQTGEVVELRRLARPLRNPRFLLLIDASRSMSEYAGFALQVAYAFSKRSRRAGAFVFSTQLREITRDLRAIPRGRPRALDDLGQAWGGGTRIGASLAAFVARYRSRINDDTVVIVASDGLDVGEIGELRHAMREISRRAASVAWINPHAGEPGFEPTAHGMRAVTPYVDEVTVWGRLEGSRL